MKGSTCPCKSFSKGVEYQHEGRKNAVFKDRGSSTEYRYANKAGNHLAKYRVDGELIADNDAKCDYLLLNCEKRASYFIELKGSDMIRAVEQIERSINLLESSLRGFIINARVVCTRINTAQLPDIRVLRLRKKVESSKGNLRMQTRLFVEECK